MSREKIVDREAFNQQIRVLSEVLVAGTVSDNPEINSVCFSAMLEIARSAGSQKRMERTNKLFGSVPTQTKEVEPFDTDTVDQTVARLSQKRMERTNKPFGSVPTQTKEVDSFDADSVDQTVARLLEALHMGLSTIKNKSIVDTGLGRKTYGDFLISLAAANQTRPKVCRAILRIAELLDFKPSEALHYELFVLASHQTHEIANTAVLLLMRFGLERLICLKPVRAAQSDASRLLMQLAIGE